MNPLLERFRRLDFDPRLAEVRGETIRFKNTPQTPGKQRLQFIASPVFILPLCTMLLALTTPRMFGCSRLLPVCAVAAFWSALFGFGWAASGPGYFTLDTRREVVRFQWRSKWRTVEVSLIDYVLVIEEPIPDSTNPMVSHVSIGDRQGRVRQLSVFPERAAAKSVGIALARFCERPCFVIDPQVDRREIWRICEPHESYCGELHAAGKLQRGHGVTRDRLADFAEVVYEPQPASVAAPIAAVNAETEAVQSEENDLVVQSARETEVADVVAPVRRYVAEEAPEVLRVRR